MLDRNDRQCDDLLPEFPLRYNVEIQRPLTTVAVVAALELAAPIETDYQRAALLHEHAGLKSAGLRRRYRRHHCRMKIVDCWYWPPLDIVK